MLSLITKIKLEQMSYEPCSLQNGAVFQQSAHHLLHPGRRLAPATLRKSLCCWSSATSPLAAALLCHVGLLGAIEQAGSLLCCERWSRRRRRGPRVVSPQVNARNAPRHCSASHWEEEGRGRRASGSEGGGNLGGRCRIR
jgi:hypothetical protein